MPAKVPDTGTDPRVVDEWEGGMGWIAHPEEGMVRASHALAVDGEVWVIEPVDAEGIDDRLAELGEVAGVVVLLDRHKRDSAAFADRYGVAVHVPAWMNGVARNLDAPIERFGGELADTGYRLRRVVNYPFWKEGALVGEDGATLLVPEAVGTNAFVRAGDERLGVHPVLRPLPPKRAFRDLSPERVLVGHGAGVMEDAAAALSDALANARRRAPRAYAEIVRMALPFYNP